MSWKKELHIDPSIIEYQKTKDGIVANVIHTFETTKSEKTVAEILDVANSPILENLPIGSTGYPKIKKVEYPICHGVDQYNRSFVILRIKFYWKKRTSQVKPVVIFDRYRDRGGPIIIKGIPYMGPTLKEIDKKILKRIINKEKIDIFDEEIMKDYDYCNKKLLRIQSPQLELC